MKRKIFYGQLAALALTLLGVAGLGFILFGPGETSMAALYLFAGLGIAGFVGNAALALVRLLLEAEGRKK
jgi:hypothetical protein